MSRSIKEAVILAAGEGTRMRPLSTYTPKPLLPIGGRPYLAVLIDRLKEVGINRVHMVIGHEANAVTDYLKERKDGIEYLFTNQKERKGTAHAIGTLEGDIKSPFLCLNGDVLFPSGHLAKVIEKFEETGEGVVSVFDHPEPERFGSVLSEGDSLSEIREKTTGDSGYINAGIYCFTPDIFEHIRDTPLSPRGEYEITDTVNRVVRAEGKGFRTVKIEGYWMDIGRPWDLLLANEILLKEMRPGIEGEVEENVVLKGPVFIGKGTVVHSGAYIVGPVYIGEDSDIGPNCFIRAYTSIGSGCKVGAASEVKNSIIRDNSNAPHHNYVGDSIIGRHCNLGSGCKTANLRLDKKNISVVLKGQKVNTGRRKLGVIMGDFVQTGINSMLNVGSIIGEHSFVGPGALASGTIAPRSRIY